jgi:hypothetical protein
MNLFTPESITILMEDVAQVTVLKTYTLIKKTDAIPAVSANFNLISLSTHEQLRPKNDCN